MHKGMWGVAGAVVVFVGLSAAPASAQKLYRWVDEDGGIHYSQSLPPEAINQARRELSARSGVVTREIRAAMSEDERTAAAAEQAILEASAKLAEERSQRDHVLVASYMSEEELSRAYRERFQLVDETLKATRVSVDSQRQALASVLTHAADRELGGQAVDLATREMIRESHARLASQQSLLQRREAERAVLDQEFQQTLTRYRELRNALSEASGAPR